MTATATITTGLSATDVKAMKQADTISFHFDYRDGSKIRCSKRVRNGGPFDAKEISHEITTQYRFAGISSGSTPRSCFEMIHGSQYSEEWQTIAHSVRVGDEVILDWHKDGHTTGYCSQAKGVEMDKPGYGMEIHADALYFKIKRGEKRLSFLLDVSVCVDNSARMIRS